MKLYRKLILLGIIVILLIPAFGVSKEENQDMKLMMDILEENNGTFEEGDICIGGVILDRAMEREEILNMGSKLRDELSIKGTPMKEEYQRIEDGYYLEELIEEEGLIQLMVYGSDNRNNFITITISTYSNGNEENWETSLFINLINREHFVENNDIIVQVEKIFDNFGKDVNVTTCIIGSIDDNINIDRIEQKIIATTEVIKGKVVEKYKDDGVLSLSIFTPEIDEYIYTGSNKMNLNIAVRYNEYEEKTHILIGTPIITIGY